MAQQARIKASEGHRAFGKLLKRVYNSDEHVIIERDGFPVAVIMSYQEYEKLSRKQSIAAFDRFSRVLGQEIEEQGLTEDELLANLKTDRKEVFDETYGPSNP